MSFFSGLSVFILVTSRGQPVSIGQSKAKEKYMRPSPTRVSKVSGTFSVRVSEATREKVRRVACAQGMSMNAYVAAAIEEALSGETALREFTRKSVG